MATITEDYVSFETAKLLKEKGFDDIDCECYGWIGRSGKHYSVDDTFYDDEELKEAQEDRKDFVPLITLQMAMKWLREVHNIYIYATPWYHEEENPLKKGEYNPVFNGWGYNISNLTTNTVIAESDEDNLYSTPEQACEIAIKYYLEKLW